MVQDMIGFEDVSKYYANASKPAVDGFSLTIASGSLQVLLGESGSGKTTVLKMVNRLIEPSSGRIMLDGTDIATLDPIGLRRQIGYAFQGVGLFPHLNVADNIGVVPKLMGWSDAEIAHRVAELLELVGLAGDEFGHRFPRELSGGQQQRVGVARALAARSRVLLMDEPFGALDPVTRDGLQSEFRALQRSLGLTVLLVTHDVNEALLLADRIAVMQHGRLLANAAPRELLHDRAQDYVSALMAMPRRQTETLTGLMEGSPPGGPGG